MTTKKTKIHPRLVLTLEKTQFLTTGLFFCGPLAEFHQIKADNTDLVCGLVIVFIFVNRRMIVSWFCS